MRAQLICLLFLAACSTTSSNRVGVDQQFVLNGCKVSPRILATPTGSRAQERGTLIQLAQHRILLSEPGDLYFVSTNRGRLERIQEDGRRRLISLHLSGGPDEPFDYDSLEDTSYLESLTFSCKRVSPFPAERFPKLRRIELTCTDWTEEDSARLREQNPDIQIRLGFRDILLDVLRPAATMRVRALPWPGGGVSEKLIYETGDLDEIAEFESLLRFDEGYRLNYRPPSSAQFVVEFLDSNGQRLAQMQLKGEGHGVDRSFRRDSEGNISEPHGVLGTCSWIRCNKAWPTPASVPIPNCDQLRDWLVARGVPRGSWERRVQR